MCNMDSGFIKCNKYKMDRTDCPMPDKQEPSMIFKFDVNNGGFC